MTARPVTSGNAPAERVALVDQQRSFGGDIGGAGDRRGNPASGPVDPLVRRAKPAADDALLHPARAFGELAVRGEAGELGARSGAARRAVICLAGTEHEIAGV